MKAILAASGTPERAVLSFQEAAGVDHEGEEELALALGEAEPGEGCSRAFRSRCRELDAAGFRA